MTQSPTHKSSECFACIFCDYSTSRKSQYNRHILTNKHKILTKTDLNSSKGSINTYKCECGNEYIHRQSLYNHKKKCTNNNKDNNKDNIIMMLLQQKSELIKEQTDVKQLILELVKNGINNTTNNINTNSNNKTFNLQIFLNETCKDAMNITDFVDSIKLQLSDLENVYYDIIAFFSPSGIKSLFDNFPDFEQKNTRMAAFGPTTAKAVLDASLILDIQAPLPNAPSMTGALELYVKKANGI